MKKVSIAAATVTLAFSMAAFAQQTNPSAAQENDDMESPITLECGDIVKGLPISGATVLRCTLMADKENSSYIQYFQDISHRTPSLPINEIALKLKAEQTKAECAGLHDAFIAVLDEGYNHNSNRDLVEKPAPVSLSGLASIYLSKGAACYAANAGILGQYDALKDMSKDYAAMTDVMKAAAAQLSQKASGLAPQPKQP